MNQLGAFEPDLVISDFKLSAFDGMQALEIVRAQSPPCFRSSLSPATSAKSGLSRRSRKGATDFILKDRLGEARIVRPTGIPRG